MITLFLTGLLAAIATIVIIHIVVMSAKQLKKIVKEKLKNHNNHKVVFVDTKEVVDDYLKNKAKESHGFTEEELRKMCEDTPFASAVVDEEGEMSEYEGIRADEYNKNFKAYMKQQEGLILVEE
jgi:hypothetical protein